jgi:3-deoxy-manno-octulosonate cytidylyltransferase (CMP-KDO synthetase)
MKALAVIPARLHSTRLPEKLIRRICDRYILQLVWERVSSAKKVGKVIIATDHEKIRSLAESFGARVMMTKDTHASGTDRLVEVARREKFPVIVNVQGDEPLIDPAAIDKLLGLFSRNHTVQMATLCYRSTDKKIYADPNVVKVVKDKSDNALYFSRSPIPFYRDSKEVEFFKHLGVYAYRRPFLLKMPRLSKSILEEAEKLEQLRVLENGHSIKVLEVKHDSIGIDTLDDLNAVEKILSRNMRRR